MIYNPTDTQQFGARDDDHPQRDQNQNQPTLIVNHLLIWLLQYPQCGYPQPTIGISSIWWSISSNYTRSRTSIYGISTSWWCPVFDQHQDWLWSSQDRTCWFSGEMLTCHTKNGLDWPWVPRDVELLRCHWSSKHGVPLNCFCPSPSRLGDLGGRTMMVNLSSQCSDADAKATLSKQGLMLLDRPMNQPPPRCTPQPPPWDDQFRENR